jgi:hypothetical protein
MANVLTNFGEEWIQRNAWGDLDSTEVEVLLYNDGTDNIQETDDIGAITSELTGSSYARQTVQVPSGINFQVVSGAVQVDFDGIAPDLSDDTGEVFDATAIIDDFQATQFANDSSPTEHLLATHVFPQSFQVDVQDGVVTINNFGVGLD